MIQIRNKTTGDISNVVSLSGYGPDWEKVADIPAETSVANLPLYGANGALNLAGLKAQQITAIKVEAERRRMQYLSPGGSKKQAYAEQAAEVRFFWTLGGTVTAIMGTLNLWSAQRRAAVFPCATEDAAAFGDTIDKAIARFAAGIALSGPVPAINAAEAKACADTRKAATSAALNAAATAFGLS